GRSALAGVVPVVQRDIDWEEIPSGRSPGATLAVGRGLLIALPLLLLFGGLFVAADAAFERIITRLFDWDLDKILNHLLISLVYAWIAAGILRTTLLPRE